MSGRAAALTDDQLLMKSCALHVTIPPWCPTHYWLLTGWEIWGSHNSSAYNPSLATALRNVDWYSNWLCETS